MAEPTSHHQPAFEKDKEHSNFSFMKRVGEETDTKPKSPGRPPLESYLDEPEEELAFSSQRIEENYPFFGTLMKRENGLMKRKEVISKSDPKDIEYVKAKYGGGGYQVRLKTAEGEEKIDFTVSGVEPVHQQSAEPKKKAIDEAFIADLRRDLKEEIRADYDDIVNRLEKRLRNKDDELDDLSRKVRNLSGELAETERKSARENRQSIKEFERKVDDLKEEKRDLEFDLFELQQELKYSDREGGFDLKGMLKDAASSPELQQLLTPILAKLFGGSPPPAQTAALADGTNRTSEQSANNNPSAEPSAPNSQQQEQQQSEDVIHDSQPNQQEQMQHLVNQFTTSIVQTAASSMATGNPTSDNLKDFVLQQIKALKANGMEPQPGMWIGISKALIEVALQNSITAEKAAQTIKPILEQFDGAANSLKFIPAKGAAQALISQFNIQVTEPQKQFLIEVLKVFKKQLK